MIGGQGKDRQSRVRDSLERLCEVHHPLGERHIARRRWSHCEWLGKDIGMMSVKDAR